MNAQPIALRLGISPNLAHAPGLIAMERGFLAARLRLETGLDVRTYNADQEAAEAILAGEIDVSYLGSGGAILAFARSNGKALRVIAGSAIGGAAFIVGADSGIQKATDLVGKRLATPQIGDTQDVALRTYLRINGLRAKEQGGTVDVLPIGNPNVLKLLQRGEIQGAWAPEPWATRLVQEGGGRILLEETALWTVSDLPAAVLVVRTDFWAKYPQTVQAVLEAHLDALVWAGANPADARTTVGEAIFKWSGATLNQATIESAWNRVRLTYEPGAGTFVRLSDDMFQLGYLKARVPNLSEIFLLGPLNERLLARRLPTVSAK